TPGYMAPEQAAGRIDKIDQRTDTYGLASVLYEILTGRPPFRGKDAEKVLSTVMESSPIPPTHYVPSIPTELESICLRGLSKSRQDRFQSAREIGEAIEVWMTSQLEHKRSLQEREKLFQLSVDLLAVVDRGGTIQHINPACESILGWTPDEMIGRTDVDLVHPDHLEDIAKHRANLATDSSPIIGLERKVLCKDGSFRWLSWNVTPVPEQAAVYIVARDITKHKRLAQFICGFRDSDHDAQLLADEDGKILMVNDAACRILNRPRGSLVDREFNDLIASESLQISDESWRLARDDHDSAASARLQFRLPEGEALEEGGGVDVGDQELQASFQAWSTTPQEFLFITLSAIIP
ncbi:MAG: PAS domain S-box protein, partial [Planctomycetota bacterium]